MNLLEHSEQVILARMLYVVQMFSFENTKLYSIMKLYGSIFSIALNPVAKSGCDPLHSFHQIDA